MCCSEWPNLSMQNSIISPQSIVIPTQQMTSSSINDGESPNFVASIPAFPGFQGYCTMVSILISYLISKQKKNLNKPLSFLVELVRSYRRCWQSSAPSIQWRSEFIFLVYEHECEFSNRCSIFTCYRPSALWCGWLWTRYHSGDHIDHDLLLSLFDTPYYYIYILCVEYGCRMEGVSQSSIAIRITLG